MSQTAPPTVDALPTPVPQRNDPTNFSTRMDALLAALPTWASQLIALGSNIYSNCLDAYNNAVAAAASAVAALSSQTAAANSANAAAASAGASAWVSGASYTAGQAAYSTASHLVYRCIANTSGTTDPSADSAHWMVAGIAAPQQIPVSGTSVTMQANGDYRLDNAAAVDAYLPATSNDGDILWVTTNNGRLDNMLRRTVAGQKICGVVDDAQLDLSGNATYGWRYRLADNNWSLL